MIDQILSHFPGYTHSLTLVHDPDGVLDDETIMATLSERGFSLITETGPILLRHQVQPLQPFNLDHPVIVITIGPLKALPYDLWQQGHPVKLALHTFFPNFSYPILQSLSSYQRWQLSQTPQPPNKLGRQASIDAILSHVFKVEFAVLQRPAGLIAWLDSYHKQPNPMPPSLAERLLDRLQSLPLYVNWPLTDLLVDQESFQRFMSDQWQLYLQQQIGQPLAETSKPYLLSFEKNDPLQDTLPQLMRSGTLIPVEIEHPERLPNWTRIGVLAPDEDRHIRRVAELLDLLAEQTTPLSQLAEARWEQWQTISRLWAELTALYYDPDAELTSHIPDLPQRYAGWQGHLDQAFLTWLQRSYSLLGSRKLPIPHHLHHIPTYIAHRRRQHNPPPPLALLIVDGLSLADWQIIGPIWRSRHPEWHTQERLILAQVPTITAISRQALVSGLRPAHLGDTLTHNRIEPRQWTTFWSQEGLDASACLYTRLATTQQEPAPELDSARLQAICLVTNAVDDLVHRAGLGTADMQASLKLWLKRESPRLEAVIERLLERGFSLYLTSDHGHTEAQGMGQPSEGILVETRSKRARVYRDKRIAEAIQEGFSETILWGEDGLLPPDRWSLMPLGRKAFAQFNTMVVTHGGVTIDEVVVPLIEISRQP